MIREFVFLLFLGSTLGSYYGGKDRTVTAKAKIEPNSKGTYKEVVSGEVYISQKTIKVRGKSIFIDLLCLETTAEQTNNAVVIRVSDNARNVSTFHEKAHSRPSEQEAYSAKRQNHKPRPEGGQLRVKGGYAENASFRVKLKGFKPYSPHGFHVHMYGDIYSNGCGSTGGHYNPFSTTHGGPNDSVRHVADLGNLYADHNGEVDIVFKDRLASLVGKHVIQGRAFVVHEGRDDLGRGTGAARAGSLTTGNAGARLACGIIYMTKNDQVLPNISLKKHSQKGHRGERKIYHHHPANRHYHGRYHYKWGRRHWY